MTRVTHSPFVFALLVSLSCGLPLPAKEIDFNRDIRPILSDKCFLCHGPDEEDREAGLRLDLRDSALESGVIEPGDAGASDLLARILSEDPDSVMPPPSTEKTITSDEIELLRAWIDQGAAYAEHWAFVPPTRPAVPSAGEGWARNPIDRFVAAQHARRQLQPSPPADKVTLIRRLSLDLTGLPPTPAEVDSFLADNTSEASERLVERLLSSRHFGERWARWWLDAARYSDSDGYEKDKQRSVWFYRDWVIAAMNEDLAYDQFIIRQIAGDLLPDSTQGDRVATGFLRNSMVNEEGGADPEQFRIEGMFDRLDAIGKSILGITTQCAQCHSHKYDPLSHREYYQMFAALNDFHEATETVYTPSQDTQRDQVLQGITDLEAELKRRTPDWRDQVNAWANREAERMASWRTVIPTDRPFEGQKFRLLDDGSIVSESYAPTKVSNTFSLTTEVDTITAFRLDALTHPQLPRGGPGRSIYGTGALSEFKVSIAPADRPTEKQEIKWEAAFSDVNPERTNLPAVFRDRDPSKDDRVTGPIEYAIDGDGKTAWSTDNGPGRRNRDRNAVFFPAKPIGLKGKVVLSFTLQQVHGGWNSDDNQNYLLGRYRFSIAEDQNVPRQALPTDVESVLRIPPADRTDAQIDLLFSQWRQTRPEFEQVNQKIESLWSGFPDSDSQLVVETMGRPRETFVYSRGDFLSPTESVAPGAPEFLNAMPENDEPPRLRFAKWLVADDAPTSARVIVNRIWQSYFGRGLVTTPEDFGFQSEMPSHPALIDWLAVELMENDWSLKHVHRLITDSATYRQSSHLSPELAESDPFNQWLARGARFRLDAELVRDGALAASGLLNDAIGGPSVYPPAPDFLFQPPASYGPKQWPLSRDGEQYRRSLYVHSYRSVPYPSLQVFDAPKGDAACVRRQRSNTPLQALVMLNEPQFVDCGRAMATRVLREGGESDVQRLTYAMRLCVSRQPTKDEISILEKLLHQQRQRVAKGAIDAGELIGTPPELYRQLTGRTAANDAPWIVVCRALLNLDETITKP